MREVYLEFYSKSLVDQETDPKAVTFSSRLQHEKDEHMEILKKICGHVGLDTYKNNYDGSNGDPTVDPLTVVEKQLSKKHRTLIGIKDEDEII